MKSIRKAHLNNNTKVLIRADLDVPIKDGKIQDTYRLDQLLPTLSYIKSKNAKIILMGHIGRPQGEFDDKLSTKNLEPYFDEVLGEGEYKLFENLRFDKREKENSEDYAREIVTKSNADIYVNESFATSHREHTSIATVPKLLPSYGGIRFAEEIDVLTNLLNNPERPLISIIGGAKVETKGSVIDKFLEISDGVLIGGKIGINWSGKKSGKLHLPTDYKTDKKDIGPKTIEEFVKIIEGAKTIVWSGPLGKFEDNDFIEGTEKVARAVVESGAYSVVGGGDTVAALKKVGVLDKIDFVSTGGGAMLMFLQNETLPALEVLGL